MYRLFKLAFRNKKIASDLKITQDRKYPDAEVYLSDSRILDRFPPNSVDSVITSPLTQMKRLHPNYCLESVILGFINNKKNCEL
jgi:DNA modification methylase